MQNENDLKLSYNELIQLTGNKMREEEALTEIDILFELSILAFKAYNSVN